jgi:hypothetical protein
MSKKKDSFRAKCDDCGNYVGKHKDTEVEAQKDVDAHKAAHPDHDPYVEETQSGGN